MPNLYASFLWFFQKLLPTVLRRKLEFLLLSEDFQGDIPEDILKVREGSGAIHPGLQSLSKLDIQGSSRDGSPDVSYTLFSGKTRLGQGPSEGSLEVG